MRTVHINASKSYNIYIDNGILNEAGTLIGSACPNIAKCAVITDDNVDKLYSAKLEKALLNAGYDVIKYVFQNGEASKSMQTLTDILCFLGKNEVTRSDAVIALGGGVVGDTAGFAASVYLRGIRFVQIPTTLLAMVDSSVGGKTAVNLPSGKNLAGAFWQPDIVICDCDVLSTLSTEHYAEGCAEIIKYGVIADRKLFDFICDNDIRNNAPFVTERCVSIKADIVMHDERDTGIRQTLNFGHTIGHAIEKCSGFKISHGNAVAIGMMIMTKGAYRNGLCKNDISENICTALRKYSLPVKCDFSAEQLFEVTLSDKKRLGQLTTLVLSDEIGSCFLEKVPCENIFDIIKAGREE